MSTALVSRLARQLALVVPLLLLAMPAAAQCPQPDGLDGGPCCSLASEKVPQFPKVTQNSLDICWRNCGIDQIGNCTAVWTPLKIQPTTGPDCGTRYTRLDLLDPAGVLKWSGNLRQIYARTWLETTPAGTSIQVWRFLVNGDLRAIGTVAAIPCPVPACAPAFNRQVRFTGYIDYAQDCAVAAPNTSIAWMLTHACDAIDHVAGFPRGGAFHPDRSYTFVGPAAGFVPAPVGAIEVTALSPFEAVRRLRPPPAPATSPLVCETEERAAVTINNNNNFCMCSVGAPLNQQWAFSNVNVIGACGTNLVTPGGPFLPGFFSMSIGTWTNAAVFPGVEYARWNVANYDDTDPCTGAVTSKVFYGATTFGGYPAAQLTSAGPGGALPPNFLDQSSSIRPGGGVLMNMAYRSDQILNLNF
ncbi:MAG: hypothetical protein ABL998_01800 [Planctomycetota bacterium]